MPSLSLPFELSQDTNTMLFSDMYNTPGLLADVSGLSGTTTSVSPSTPLYSSPFSPASFRCGPNGTRSTCGGNIAHDPNAYNQLLHHYQEMECKLTKEREECTSLKEVP